MAKGKGRDKAKLESTAVLESGEPSKHFYTITIRKGATYKNGKNTIELMKYDPRVKKHVLYKQKKMK